MYRTAVHIRDKGYEFGEWKPYEVALMQMLSIAHQWGEQEGYEVKSWGELCSHEDERLRLAAVQPGSRKWEKTIEIVYND